MSRGNFFVPTDAWRDSPLIEPAIHVDRASARLCAAAPAFSFSARQHGVFADQPATNRLMIAKYSAG